MVRLRKSKPNEGSRKATGSRSKTLRRPAPLSSGERLAGRLYCGKSQPSNFRINDTGPRKAKFSLFRDGDSSSAERKPSVRPNSVGRPPGHFGGRYTRPLEALSCRH